MTELDMALLPVRALGHTYAAQLCPRLTCHLAAQVFVWVTPGGSVSLHNLVVGNLPEGPGEASQSSLPVLLQPEPPR